jgi:hypothetical protein
VPEKLTLIFLIDALGYEQAKTGSFLHLLDRPRRPIRSVLGYSSACLPTIMTGLSPAGHGHFSMYRRASNGGVFAGPGRVLPLLSHLTGRHWRLRQWTTRYLRWRGVTGYFSLYDIPLSRLHFFDLCQRRNLYRPGAFDGIPGLPDHLETAGGHRIWDWSANEAQAFSELEEEIERAEKRFLLFYSAELDALMHASGPESEATRRKLEEYDRRITALHRRARERYREVSVFAFGDHGMAPVRRSHDLWSSLEALPFRVPDDFLYFLDSSMARFWFHADPARPAVRSLLEGLDYGRVLPDDELERLGANFPRREYGELIFLLDEGEILVPSFMGLSPVRGMHGYHPDAGCSYTTLATNRHDLEYPEDLCQLHHLLRREALDGSR